MKPSKKVYLQGDIVWSTTTLLEQSSDSILIDFSTILIGLDIVVLDIKFWDAPLARVGRRGASRYPEPSRVRVKYQRVLK